MNDSVPPDDELWERALGHAFSSQADAPSPTPEGAPRDESVIEFLARRGETAASVVLREPRGRDSGPVVTPSAAPQITDPRYEVLGEVARGGFGVILKARDRELGRDIAIKVLRTTWLGRPGVAARFVAEAQIAGQLQHPAIVPVYDVGIDPQRRPYFTMKLVRGRTLSALLRERSSPDVDLRRYLRVFEQLADAVAYAHARGVVHRDLKPSNVMVGAFGEVQILDWGIAHVLAQGGVVDADPRPPHADAEPADYDASPADVATIVSRSEARLSQAGRALGTPAYMSPEQARGDLDRLDERTDVFSLGAILCEMLTGEPPHAGTADPEELLRSARGDLSECAERLSACGADPALVELAQRCLEPAPERRPTHAGEVAQTVASYFESLQQRAREAELAAAEERAQAVSAIRTKRLALGLGSLIVLAVTVGSWIFLEARERHQFASAAAVREVGELLAEASVYAAQRDFDGAREAAKRAQARAAAPAAPADLRATVAERLATYAELDRRQDLVQRFDSIRSSEDVDLRLRARAYEEAFSAFGVDVRDESVARIAEQLVCFAGDDLASIVPALDHWAVAYRIDRSLRDKLLAVANRIDSDARRRDVRHAVADDDQPKLVRLASDSGIVDGPSENALLVATALMDHPDEASQAAIVELLRASSERHPEDFWLHFRIAVVAVLRGRAPLDVGIRHAEIAVALRPRDAQVRAMLGLALVLQARSGRAPVGEVDDLLARAAACLDWSSARTPDDRWIAVGRAHLMAARGDIAGAQRAIDDLVKAHPRLRERPHLVAGFSHAATK